RTVELGGECRRAEASSVTHFVAAFRRRSSPPRAADRTQPSRVGPLTSAHFLDRERQIELDDRVTAARHRKIESACARESLPHDLAAIELPQAACTDSNRQFV